jgi:hypothetical protein
VGPPLVRGDDDEDTGAHGCRSFSRSRISSRVQAMNTSTTKPREAAQAIQLAPKIQCRTKNSGMNQR